MKKRNSATIYLSLKLGNCKLNRVKQLKYLRSLILMIKNEIEREVATKRILLVNKDFYRFAKLLRLQSCRGH